jgi:Flp pilus assembly protein TadD
LTGAARHLRETLSLKPNDSEAKALLDAVSANASARATRGVVAASEKIPLERIRTNYDESSFRQLELKIGAAAEQRLAKTDPRTHAQFHNGRGHQLLAQGFLSEAEHEFREAVALDSSLPEAHAGLASALEAQDREPEARSQAEQALRLREFPEPLLVLARLDLRDNRTDAAAENVNRALHIEPSNAAAVALKGAVAAKLAQKAQPLPNR